MELSIISSQLLVGLSRAMVLFIVASGLTLVFGVLRVINFAHGSFYMLGAFLTFTVTAAVGMSSGGFWFAVLIAPLGVAAISLLIERGLLRFIYEREHLIQVLLTYALVLIIGDTVRLVWGVQFKSVPVPGFLTGSFSLGITALPRYNFFLLLIGPPIALGLWFFLYRTHIGRICRATAIDREMVDALGINSRWVFTTVFVLGSWMAGLGGSLMSPTVNITLGMDTYIVLNAFLIVVIGGLGNIWGALVSSLIFGIGESLGALFWPNFAIVIPFFIAAAVLLVKPSGLLKSVW